MFQEESRSKINGCMGKSRFGHNTEHNTGLEIHPTACLLNSVSVKPELLAANIREAAYILCLPRGDVSVNGCFSDAVTKYTLVLLKRLILTQIGSFVTILVIA